MAVVERETEPVREKETVVVDRDERKSSGSWAWVVVAIVIILLLFFVFGGMSLFGGGQTSAPTTMTAPTGSAQ